MQTLIDRVLAENPDYAERLGRLAEATGIPLEQMIEKALKDYLDYIDEKDRRRGA